MQKCTLGKRHKWVFVKHTSDLKGSKNSLSISKKSLYKCACGQEKIGSYCISQL